MFDKPSPQHQWFNTLLGNWEFEHHCANGSDQPTTSSRGTLTGRSLGGLWTVLECQSESPDGAEPWTSVFTLGYNPQSNRYHGTFVASMMTHLWLYEGQLDPTGKQLILDVEGPRMDGSGMAKYQDIFETLDRDHWILRSRILGDDGNWTQFMEGHHRRIHPIV